MSNNNLLKTAEDLVKYGKSKGADQVQVSIGEGSSFTVECLNQSIENLTEAGSRSLSLKVILDNKVATASSSDLSPEALHQLTDNAIERAKLTSSDPFAGLPDNDAIQVDIDSLKLFDPKILELTPEHKIAMAKEVEAIAVKGKNVKSSNGSYYGTNIGRTIIANSNGFSGDYKHSVCYNGVGLQSGKGDKIYEDGWYESSLNVAGLMGTQEIAEKAIHVVTRMLNAKKIKTQVVPIVFEPKMTSMLLRFLSSCINGRSIYMKQSWLIDMIGKEIAGKDINITDDPTIVGAKGSRPFDGEGVPGKKMPIIENGILKNYILSTYSAKKLGMKSTGGASGSSNFYMAAGSHSQEEIIKSVDKGLLLTSTIGQGTVPTTGDISKGAYGIWIENGELTYPVSEVTFTGNLASMLKNISMIGNDLKFDRAVAGPTIKIDGMSISGL
ncbi:MAG: TldD/PmbA family protein [Candidatus Kapabacteria bacterium]|jgi:PmbA protein|nr:TldD/PmbA family protein [Candidatus Kapabacteria bacterium]